MTYNYETRRKAAYVAAIKLGALYRFGHRRKLPRETVEALLVKRLRFSVKDAGIIAGHWFGTDAYRRAAKGTTL